MIPPEDKLCLLLARAQLSPKAWKRAPGLLSSCPGWDFLFGRTKAFGLFPLLDTKAEHTWHSGRSGRRPLGLDKYVPIARDSDRASHQQVGLSSPVARWRRNTCHAAEKRRAGGVALW